MADVVELYAENAIHTYTTAKSIIARLSSGRKTTNGRALQALNELRAEKEYLATGRAKLLTTYSKRRKGRPDAVRQEVREHRAGEPKGQGHQRSEGQAEVCGHREGQPSRRERS